MSSLISRILEYEEFSSTRKDQFVDHIQLLVPMIFSRLGTELCLMSCTSNISEFQIQLFILCYCPVVKKQVSQLQNIVTETGLCSTDHVTVNVETILNELIILYLLLINMYLRIISFVFLFDEKDTDMLFSYRNT